MTKQFVSFIYDDEIELYYVPDDLAEQMKEKGMAIRKSSKHKKASEDALFIPYDSKSKEFFSWANGFTKNEDLSSLCSTLNNMGFSFRKNFKMDASPSDYMKDLHDRGVLKSSFQEVSWDSGRETIETIRHET